MNGQAGARLALALVLAGGLAAAVTAQVPDECSETPTRHAVRLEGLSLQRGETVSQHVAEGWHLRLEPHRFGWQLRLRDGVATDALDLSQVTPPHQGLPNPRDIFGWHFRNAANSGPNVGDVNAPQHRRRFLFSTALAGTGGYKPSTDPDAPRYLPPDPDDGRGSLAVSGLTLSPPAPGEQAHIEAITLDICVSWPKAHAVDRLTYLDEEREMLGDCGLDLHRWALRARIAPRMLQGDFDGDGSWDMAAQVTGPEGEAALALCRAGTWLELLEATDARLPEGLPLGSVEAWRTLPADHGPLGYVDEPPWPAMAGEAILLARIEKSAHLLYWRDGGWHVSERARIVTE